MATTFKYQTAGAVIGGFNTIGAVAARVKTLRTLQVALVAQRETLLTQTDPTQRNLAAEGIMRLDELIVRASETAATIAQNLGQILIDQVDTEEEIPRKDVREMVRRLIEFMDEDAEAILESDVGSSTTADGSNDGDGELVIGVTAPDGKEWQNIRAEKIVCECIKDAQGTNINAGEELFSLKGEAAVPNLHKDWPAGSGIDCQIKCTHGGEEQKSGPGYNMLQNGNLKQWEDNEPDGWTVDVGTKGTDIFMDNTDPCRGTKHGKIVGTAGAVLVKFSQDLNDSAGRKLRPYTAYCLSIWLQDGTAAPTAGTLRLSLQDGAGNILGTDCYTTVALNDLAAAYANTSVIVVTPDTIPAAAKFVVDLTVACENAKDFYFDEIVLCEAYHPQPAGPYFALVAGENDWHVRAKPDYSDRIVATMTNDWSDDTFNREIDRLFDVYGMGELIPTTSTGVILDSLIT